LSPVRVVIRRTYVLITARTGLLSPIPRLFCAKELYISAKEPYISAKEPYISAHKPYRVGATNVK